MKFQYQLKTLLGIVSIVCLLLAIRELYLSSFQRDREIARKLSERGAFVTYRTSDSLIVRLVAWGPQTCTTRVNLSAAKRRDIVELLPLLQELPQLENLNLDSAEIVDQDMPYIGRLSTLRGLSLANTSVSDRGVNSLMMLTELESLWLDHTQVSASMVRQLISLPKLLEVGVSETGILTTDLEIINIPSWSKVDSNNRIIAIYLDRSKQAKRIEKAVNDEGAR
jgi:hypothetical protein